MKNLIKISFLLLIIGGLFNSCDKLESTNGYYFNDTLSVTNNDTTQNSDTITNVKKVLLVDFTGIRCVNCPEAHEIIHQIQSLHPGQVVPIAFHVTNLARPSGDYVTNLRTDEGNEIASTFDITEIPIGLIDAFDKTQLKQRTQWAAIVDTCVTQKANVGLKIEYSLSDSTLNVNITMKSFKNLDNDPTLCVYLLEDSIITRQSADNDSGYIENYVQMNVFRKALTNVWGEQVSGLKNSGSQTTIKYSTTLSSKYNPNHCKVVAFLKNNSNFVINSQLTPYVTK